MAASKAQMKATAKFAKKTYKTFLLKIRRDNLPVLDKLAEVQSKNKYIIELIENDIKKQ